MYYKHKIDETYNTVNILNDKGLVLSNDKAMANYCNFYFIHDGQNMDNK